MNGLIRLLLQGVAIFAASYLIPGIFLTNFWYALLVALILSVVNVTVKPILQILSFPITILTLGFFVLVINALMVMLVDYLIPDFSVKGFWTAMLFSIVNSIIFWVLDAIISDKK
jgi:putative membrane protein